MTPEARANQILKTLDRQARKYEFPAMGSSSGYWYFGAIRLHVFRSSAEWLLIFDSIIYNIGLAVFDHLEYACGNKVKRKDEIEGDAWRLRENIRAAPGHPITSPETGAFLLDRFDFSVSINGQNRRFSPDPSDYAGAGVDVDSSMPIEAQILRLLVFQVGDDLFLSPEQLLELCGKVNSALDHFVTLDHWHHPDLLNDEMPSESSTFQMLAAAIAQNDRSLYKPNKPPNTHWSFWLSVEE